MAQFLNRLLKIFRVYPSKSDLTATVGDDENIARFIFSSSHFAQGTSRVKYGAYQPAKNRQASVYRIYELSTNEVWDIGAEYVESGQRKIRAYAEVKTLDVTRQKLKVEPDTKVHFRHANIVAWPQEKDEIKMLAIEIANSSKLHVK